MSAVKGIAIFVAILFTFAVMGALLRNAGRLTPFGRDHRSPANVIARNVCYLLIIACGLGLIGFLAMRHV
jgi:hypothetical protein